MQRQLIYFPSGSQIPTPIAAGVPEMQVVDLHTKDGLTLQAWYSRATQPTKPTVVYFHGNAGHIGHRASIIKPFLKAGYGVLLVTYRGYSGNPGKPSEKGLYEDGRAAIKFLTKKKVPQHCLVLYGESVGTAVAVQMATEYPVGAIVLQAPFTSLVDVAKFHYPFFPVKWLLKDRFASVEKVKNVHAPVFILHGSNDSIIPPVLSRQLLRAFKRPKQADYIPDTGHNDLYEPSRVINFIDKTIKCF